MGAVGLALSRYVAVPRQVVPHGDENAECCEAACRAAAMRVELGDSAETVWCRESFCHRLLRIPAGASGLADCLPY